MNTQFEKISVGFNVYIPVHGATKLFYSLLNYREKIFVENSTRNYELQRVSISEKEMQ